MFESLALSSFIAGILTFLAPCTLPLLPAFLSFIGSAAGANFSDEKRSRRRVIFISAIFFVCGFSVIFIATGILAGFVGAAILGAYRLWLERIGGVFVAVSGLFLLGILHIPPRFNMGVLRREEKGRGRYFNSFFLGAAFSFGWTPCVGPILGSVLFLASSSATATEGGLLLLIFSAGLALPFLLAAFFLETFLRHMKGIAVFSRVLSTVGGIFLVILGVLLIFDKVGLLISYGYSLFETFGYDRLLNYL